MQDFSTIWLPDITELNVEASAREEVRKIFQEAQPSGDNAFKIELARRIVSRALTLAAAGTPDRIAALPASPFAQHSGAPHV